MSIARLESTKNVFHEKLTGGWKKFKTRDGKIIEFFVPLGTKRKRRYCPKCKTTFNVCPFEENKRLVHHFLCSNRCKIINGMCQYTYMSKQLGIKIEPPTCGTIVGRHRTCGSCLHFSRKKVNPEQPEIGICKAYPNTYTSRKSTIADTCPKYINRTHKNK